jgi:AraC-like DNA-binding protein
VTQLGIPGQLAGTASNVGVALRDIVDYLYLHDQGGVATMHTSSRLTAVGYAITLADVEAVDQVYDLCISILCGVMRAFCGSGWNPVRVELSRSNPKNPQPYKDYFCAPVLFDSPRSAIVFANKWLSHPLVTADGPAHQHFTADAQILHVSLPNNVSLQVRIVLYSRLTHAICDATAIADLLGLHERTMHRRLQREGTSFRQLLDEARKITSRNYLKGTNLQINSIASALGYGSTGAFDHAFRRWYGQTPKQWRESQTH